MPLKFALLFKIFPEQNYRAMAFWPFIFVKEISLINDKTVMNHERIHLAQQLELQVLPFYILYFSEFFFHRLIKKNHAEAYRAISFEKEAYGYDGDLKYLKNRKIWAGFKKT